jgi:2-dehydro-3-deoxyphosphogluconate aldolase/(4S)-4-hydroxy-2-oxoglutarate aldolase
VSTLKALGAVYPDVPFMPTGGINADNLTKYLALDNVLCIGGSWLTEGTLLTERRFDEIERRARHAAELSGNQFAGNVASRAH